MRKNITFTADEHLIERARARAKAEHSTLNLKFRDWLQRYAGLEQSADLKTLMEKFTYAEPGRRFTREEMNLR